MGRENQRRLALLKDKKEVIDLRGKDYKEIKNVLGNISKKINIIINGKKRK